MIYLPVEAQNTHEQDGKNKIAQKSALTNCPETKNKIKYTLNTVEDLYQKCMNYGHKEVLQQGYY